MEKRMQWGRIYCLAALWLAGALWLGRSEVRPAARPAGKITSLNVSQARLTDLSLGAWTAVPELVAHDNILSLSSIYKLLQNQPVGSTWEVQLQNDTAYLSVGGQLDLRNEMTIGGMATEWRLTDASGGVVPETVYTMQNGRLQIWEVGSYYLSLTNARVTDAGGRPIVFGWEVRVSPQPEVIVMPAGKITSLDCNAVGYSNRLTALILSTQLRLSAVSVAGNHLPLSSLYQLLACQTENAIYILHPQADTVHLFEGSVMDLRKELTIGGTTTDWRLADAADGTVPESAYTLADGRLQIWKPGEYRLTLSNARVTDLTAGHAASPVTHTYEITVSPLVTGPRDGRITAFVCNGTFHGGDLLGIDVRDCASLRYLDCDSGGLTSLDVTRNPGLSVLSCRFNRLDYPQVTGLSRQMQAQGAEAYVFYPQQVGSDTLELGEPLNLSDYVPELDGVAGNLSLMRYGDTMRVGQDYMVDGHNLYVVRGGPYRLSVWHEAVVEKTAEGLRPYVVCHDLMVNGDTAYPFQPPVENADTVARPEFWPQKDTLRPGELITLTCATDSAWIYYTRGDDTVLIRYADGILLNETATLVAMAVRPGWVPSATVSRRYVVAAGAEVPTDPEQPGEPTEPIVEGAGASWIWMARAGEEKEMTFKGTGRGFRVDWGDGHTGDAKAADDGAKDSEKEWKHRYAAEGIYTVKLEPLSESGRITELDVSEERVLSLRFGDVSMLQELDCSENLLQALDLQDATKLKELDCDGNRLTDLRLPSHSAFKEVEGEYNRLRLSTIYGLLSQRVKHATYAFNPQSDSVTLAAEAVWDLSAEMRLGDRNTTYTVVYADTRCPAAAGDYSVEDGRFRFNRAGMRYLLYMENANVTDYDGGKAGYPVAFSWHVHVSGVGNEAHADGWGAKVYVRARTVFLTEDLGEVEVYTAAGVRVFRGRSQAINVPAAGLYLVRAAGHDWKVVVR